MEYYVSVLRDRYAQFTGRARRKEFWMFALINFCVSLVIAIIGAIIHLSFLQTLYSLAVLVPSLAVGVRRLHDIDKSGWWILIGLIPVIGWIIIIVWYATEGQATDNQYGPNPKAATATAAAPSSVPPATPPATPAA